MYFCDTNSVPTLGYDCKTKEEILDKIKELKIEFIQLQSNFQADDIEKPLVSYLGTLLPRGLMPDAAMVTQIELQQNVAITNDDFFGQA